MLLSFGVLVVCCSIAQGQIPPAIVKYAEVGTGKENLDLPGDVKKTGFKLICEASGSLPLTFTWKHNDKDVIRDSYHLIMKNATKPREEIYHVREARTSDDGKYQCLVKNAWGGTFTTKLRVKLTYGVDFKKAENVIEKQQVTVGRPLRLVCPADNDYSPEFGAVHVWGRRKGNFFETIKSDSHRTSLPNGDFLFPYLKQSDIDEIHKFPDKTIQCIVNAGNTIYISHQFDLLNVTKTVNNKFGPMFEKSDYYPKTQEHALHGRSKELFCAAAGNPVPKITWYRLKYDKTVLKKIENGKDGFLLRDFSLLINMVSMAQHEDGYYKCVASNGVGPDVHSPPTKLEVFVTPQWTVIPPKEHYVPIEDNSDLLCEAFGAPPPSYKWYHNGTAFKSDNELGPNVIVAGQYLKFRDMKQSNQGVYQCAVENDWGMLVSSTWVKVKASAPDIKNFGPFYLFKETNATLECQSDAAPRADHTWYINGKELKIKGRYSLDKKGSLVITGVTDSDGGKYECKAKNSIGSDAAEAQATVYAAPACGQKPYSVVNGNNVSPHAWPWHVSIRVEGRKKGHHICSGTLIKPNWVVTAAHCVSMSLGARKYRVVVGAHHKKSRFGKTAVQRTFRVKKIYKHRRFSKKLMKNDIALLQLKGSVQTSSKVNTVCLPQKGTQAITGKECYVTGWERKATTLQQAKFPVSSHGSCNSSNGRIIPIDKRSMICAGGLGKGICHGDSGGPLVCKEGSWWVLRGALSWGYRSCRRSGRYTVFARVSNFIDWINKKTS